MTRRMLIDATHPEETRVTVVEDAQLEEFEFETSAKQQIKSNIYLAKVTRVEPSLQACFVEYGGNRQGFLAFSEIHPDYYQIPAFDRDSLVRAAEEEWERKRHRAQEESDQEEDTADLPDDESEGDAPEGDDHESDDLLEEGDIAADEDDTGDDPSSEEGKLDDAGDAPLTSAALRRTKAGRAQYRQYKIQEVIKRNQILLVQVVKEERGNKGAAMTTYISLAGRYCVLMPNSSRGGGVSKKISNGDDRKRLKKIIADLNVPQDMAVILRTAGAARSRAEIKRDYDYITRLWDTVRDKTMESIAPSLIHDDGNLVKRAIRDLYDKDIDEILVAGDEAYRAAKGFMKSLIPSHARKVKAYRARDNVPLFHNYNVEKQLAQIHNSTIGLKSGGSIVIHQTEALVAIDINSGKATRERHIEETALKTNLEAADEIARQLRLRDLAGLIVIDFIDMESNRNDHTVERKLKEALRRDRARIQSGRISDFGLLELSRQRLRPSLLETTSQPCPHCGGGGYVVSIESAALSALRVLEEMALNEGKDTLKIAVPTNVALYMLNQKRHRLTRLEEDYGLVIHVEGDSQLIAPNYRLDNESAAPQQPSRQGSYDRGGSERRDHDRRDHDRRGRDRDQAQDKESSRNKRGGRSRADGMDGQNQSSDRPRQRYTRRRHMLSENPEQNADYLADSENGPDQMDMRETGNNQASGPQADSGDGEQTSEPKRRRGRRGGRNRRKRDENQQAASVTATETESAETTSGDESQPVNSEPVADSSDAAAKKPAPRSRRRSAPRKSTRSAAKKAEENAASDSPSPEEAKGDIKADSESSDDKPAKRKPVRRRKKAAEQDSDSQPATPFADEGGAAPQEAAAESDAPASPENTSETAASPPRRGWWRRALSKV